MYKKILIATDGAELSQIAIDHGLRLAKALGATVLGITVSRPLSAYAVGEAAIAIDANVFEERMAGVAQSALEKVSAAASRLGVECSMLRVRSERVYEGIVAAANEHDCDLIVMASHGRSGVSAMLLGSETTKVLTHSKVPVLVCR